MLEATMASKQQLARILGAIAVLATIALAPSIAAAHAGHVHAQPVHQTTAMSSQPAQLEVTASAALPSEQSDDADCADRGCCASGPCTGCHGFVLTSLPVYLPSLHSTSLASSDADPRPSPHDGRLRRPPKSFA
jgi:hypothetical protein